MSQDDANVVIERIGHLGDGIGHGPNGAVHIPFSAPGDVYARNAGAENVWSLVQAGEGRIAAPCPHYGVCGGCDLQHLAPDIYAQSKREWVVAALANQGLDAPVEPLVAVQPASRRRATFAAIGTKDGPVIGFHRPRSHEVIAVPGCLVVRPRIIKALGAVRALLAPRLGPGQSARITITEGDNGLDVAIEASKGLPQSLDVTEIETGCIASIVRATWNGDLLYATDTVRFTISGVRIELPPRAFIQAVKESEEALAARVTAALEGAKRVADLYAGVGTFAFPLARFAAVDAFEAESAAVNALVTGSRRAEGLKPVSPQTRDLARRPLMHAELKAYDGVVLDPPRAGAEVQARQLAKSTVKRIAYVSCHPASFARDARILTEGGYRLERVTPIDQFLWSHHVELVGVFSR